MTDLIVWRDEFKTGCEEIDQEHHELIDWINRLARTLDQGGSRGEVAAFLGEIHARISAHFALEERLMRAWHYDQYAQHKADHEALLDEIADIMDAWESSTSSVLPTLGLQLERWFSVHFRTHDARLHTRHDLTTG